MAAISGLFLAYEAKPSSSLMMDCVDPVVDVVLPTKRPSRIWVNHDSWSSFRGREGERKAISTYKKLKYGTTRLVRLLEILCSAYPDDAYGLKIRDVIRACTTLSDWSELVVTLNDSSYLRDDDLLSDPVRFAWVHQIHCLLKKYPFEGSEDRATAAAVTNFMSQEAKNLQTNRRWRELDNHPLLERLSERISEILGPAPSWDEVIAQGKFGPGTVMGYPFHHSLTSVAFKATAPITCFLHNRPLIPRVLDQYPLWLQSLGEHYKLYGLSPVEVVPSTEMFTVRKDARTDRTAFKEPLLESFLQGGVGNLIRKRFLAEQRDLNSSFHTCRELAYKGSLTDLWCTVDLSSASDSICQCVVRSFLSDSEKTSNLNGWFNILNSLRSKEGLVPEHVSLESGEVISSHQHQFELFSSMGNGFTWELESLLFYAVMTVVVPGIWVSHHGRPCLRWPHVGIFGDDMVFPSAYAPQVCALLEHLGFAVNLKKSFFRGPFRESCGEDYISGINVRPLFIKELITNGSELVELANRCREHGRAIADRLPQGGGHYRRLWERCWVDMVGCIPRDLRRALSTPDGVPSGLYLGERDDDPSFSLDGRPLCYRLVMSKPQVIDLTRFIAEVYCHVEGERSKSRPLFWGMNGSNLLFDHLHGVSTGFSLFAKMTPATGEGVFPRKTTQISIGWSQR